MKSLLRIGGTQAFISSGIFVVIVIPLNITYDLYTYIGIYILSIMWLQLYLFVLSHLYPQLCENKFWYPLYIGLFGGCFECIIHFLFDWKHPYILSHGFISILILIKSILIYLPIVCCFNICRLASLSMIWKEYEVYCHLYPGLSRLISGNYICRICHESDNKHQLIGPCKCSGSIWLVHTYCLNKWRSHSPDPYTCNMCGSKYYEILYG